MRILKENDNDNGRFLRADGEEKKRESEIWKSLKQVVAVSLITILKSLPNARDGVNPFFPFCFSLTTKIVRVVLVC